MFRAKDYLPNGSWLDVHVTGNGLLHALTTGSGTL